MTAVEQLKRLQLRHDDDVTASGALEVDPGRVTRLWVAPSWRPGSSVRLEGGQVELSLASAQPSTVDDDDADRQQLVTVSGKWNGTGITDATCQALDSSPRSTVVSGDERFPEASRLSVDERETIRRQIREHAGSSALAIGGTSSALTVQVLRVTDEFLRWYSEMTAVRIDVAVSIIPQSVTA